MRGSQAGLHARAGARMTRRSHGRAERVLWPRSWRWRLLLGLSLLGNVAILANAVLFYPDQTFSLACIEESGAYRPITGRLDNNLGTRVAFALPQYGPVMLEHIPSTLFDVLPRTSTWTVLWHRRDLARLSTSVLRASLGRRRVPPPAADLSMSDCDLLETYGVEHVRD